MPKQTIPFSDFLAAAGIQHESFINHLHTYLQKNDCVVKLNDYLLKQVDLIGG